MSELIRLKAVEIVEAAERAKGWSPHVLGSVALEKEHGCDIVSTGRTGERDLIEVKGWGEPFLGPSGRFLYDQDIRQSQMLAATKSGDRFRIEIVANLTAHIYEREPYERLTLSAEEVSHAKPLLWAVELAGKESAIRREHADPAPRDGT